MQDSNGVQQIMVLISLFNKALLWIFRIKKEILALMLLQAS